MPGHVKKSDGPDPDPDPWLVVSYDLKQRLKAKPYDPKKSCWVPDKATGGYWEGLIDSTDGDKVTVTILETKDVSKNSFPLVIYRNQKRQILETGMGSFSLSWHFFSLALNWGTWHLLGLMSDGACD